MFGMSKYGSTIARDYYTFTEMHHDEWFDITVNNLKDAPFKIESSRSYLKSKMD